MKHLMQRMAVLMGMLTTNLVAWGGNCPCDELRINEICYAPADGGPQWVEIVNTGDEPVFPNGAELVGDSGAFTLPGELGGIPGRGIVLVVFDGADASENRYECAIGAPAVLHAPADGAFGNPVGFCGLYRVTEAHSPETLLDFLAWGGEPGAAAADAVAKGVWSSSSRYLVTGAGGEIGPYVRMQAGGTFARASGSYIGWSVLGPGDATFGAENLSLAAPTLHYPPADDWGEGEPSYFSWFPVMNATRYDFQLADSPDFTNLLAEANGLAECLFDNEDGLGLPDGVCYWRVRAHDDGGPGAWSAARKLEKGYWFLLPSAGADETVSAVDADPAPASRALDQKAARAFVYVRFDVFLKRFDDDGNEQTDLCDTTGLFLDAKDVASGNPLNFLGSKLLLQEGQEVRISLKESFQSATEWFQAGDSSPDLPTTGYVITAKEDSARFTISPKRKMIPGFQSFGAQKDSRLMAIGHANGKMCTQFGNEGDQGWNCWHDDCHPEANAQENSYCWAAALKMLCHHYGDRSWNGDRFWTRDAIVLATKGGIWFALQNAANYDTIKEGASHVFDNGTTMQTESDSAKMAKIIAKCVDANWPAIIVESGRHAMVVSGYQWMMTGSGAPGLQVFLNNTDNRAAQKWKNLANIASPWLFYPTESLTVNQMPKKYTEDTDWDGVMDADEERFGTDIINEDTDGDGIDDSAEIASGVFPRYVSASDKTCNEVAAQGGNIGTAGFPVTNGRDAAHTAATTPDTDGGGIPDGREDLIPNGIWEASAGETDVFNKQDDNQMDVAFNIDTTGSMDSMLSSVKRKATDIVRRFLSSDAKSAVARRDEDTEASAPARFAVVAYRDKGDAYVYKTMQGLTANGNAVVSAINSLTADGGGDTPEAVNDALLHTINMAGWRGGAVKRRIILMGDAPDNGRGATLAQVQAACQRTGIEVSRRGVRRHVAREALGPVSIITLPVGNNRETLANFREIAEATDGVCIPVGSAADTGEAVFAALEAIETTPVVELAVEGGWGAKHIVADASGSTDPQGCGIVKYEWDWEADGTYDEWSFSPIAEKDYPSGFQGKMRVRATTATGDKGTRTIIIAAPEFLDVTTLTDLALAAARLDPNTGAIVCDITLGNKTDTVKTLKDKFWFVLPSTSTIFLASPDGTMEDGTPYVDITALVEDALPSVGNGDLRLDPGESVVLRDAIAIYSRDRSVPTGFMFAVWADPPPDTEVAVLASETVDGVQWSYDVDAGEATVTGAEPATGNLTIPSVLGGCPVTGLGAGAFASCEGLTGVTIPGGVRRIGSEAFRGCSGLTSVALPEGLKRIESHAFFGTGLETVTVPKSVRWIGGSAFASSALRSATILGGAISGEDGAFTGCSSLKTLTLGTRVSAISYYAFANYSSRGVELETVHAPVGWEGKPNPLSGGFFGADFTVLYDNAVDDGEPTEEEEEYEDAWSFQVVDGGAVVGMYSEVGGKVVIPSTLGGCPVTAIADFAFYYDGDVITSLRIPDTVTNVGSMAFANCNALTALYVPESWEGTAMLDNAGVPEGCTVVYGAAPEKETTTTGVPYTWIDENVADILAANGGDHEAAAKAAAANGMPVWACFVAGLSPTDPAAAFKITAITVADGEVKVEWDPDLGGDRTYVVEGKAAMESEWGPCDASSRFFRVRVVLGQETPEPDAHKGVQLWKDGPYWAETNIGAESPEDYGLYFWWGDTVGYRREGSAWVASDGSTGNFSFSSPNTPTTDKSVSTLQSEGWIDASGNLTPEHDAAQVHWGGGWRMPTDSEFAALISNTTTTWTTSNGVYGRLVTGKGDYASASIFLPAAGYGNGTGLDYSGSDGGCRSSTPSSWYWDRSWSLYFGSGSFFRDDYSRYYNGRYGGQSVRALRGFAE